MLRRAHAIKAQLAATRAQESDPANAHAAMHAYVAEKILALRSSTLDKDLMREYLLEMATEAGMI